MRGVNFNGRNYMHLVSDYKKLSGKLADSFCWQSGDLLFYNSDYYDKRTGYKNKINHNRNGYF